MVPLIILAVAAVAGPAVTAGITLHLTLGYLQERDRRDGEERSLLANRIQAPDVAIAQSVDTGPPPEPVDPFAEIRDFEAQMERQLEPEV